MQTLLSIARDRAVIDNAQRTLTPAQFLTFTQLRCGGVPAERAAVLAMKAASDDRHPRSPVPSGSNPVLRLSAAPAQRSGWNALGDALSRASGYDASSVLAALAEAQDVIVNALTRAFGDNPNAPKDTRRAADVFRRTIAEARP